MIRLHGIKYCDKYYRYYEVWYKIDPKSVESYKVPCTHKNIDMLLRLGLRDCDKYIKCPDRSPCNFSVIWATYYIAKYKLEGICPYKEIIWEDEPPFYISMESDVMVQYIRYFKKYGIPIGTDKYNICIESVKSEVLDIIDNINTDCIIRHYINTGKLREYINASEPITYMSQRIPDNDVLDRIIESGYVTCLHILMPTNDRFHDLVLLMRKHNISIKLGYYDILNASILLEYDMIDIDELDIISLDYIQGLYKIIMYTNGLMKIWNKYKSNKILYIIMRHASNLLNKITTSQCILNLRLTDIEIKF